MNSSSSSSSSVVLAAAAHKSHFSAAVDLSHTELVSTLAGYVRARGGGPPPPQPLRNSSTNKGVSLGITHSSGKIRVTAL